MRLPVRLRLSEFAYAAYVLPELARARRELSPRGSERQWERISLLDMSASFQDKWKRGREREEGREEGEIERRSQCFTRRFARSANFRRRNAGDSIVS